MSCSCACTEATISDRPPRKTGQPSSTLAIIPPRVIQLTYRFIVLLLFSSIGTLNWRSRWPSSLEIVVVIFGIVQFHALERLEEFAPKLPSNPSAEQRSLHNGVVKMHAPVNSCGLHLEQQVFGAAEGACSCDGASA